MGTLLGYRTRLFLSFLFYHHGATTSHEKSKMPDRTWCWYLVEHQEPPTTTAPGFHACYARQTKEPVTRVSQCKDPGQSDSTTPRASRNTAGPPVGFSVSVWTRFLHLIRIYLIEFAALVSLCLQHVCLPKHRLRSVGSYQQATTAAQATPFTPRRAGLHWNSPLGLTIYASVFSLEQIVTINIENTCGGVWRTKAVRPWLAKYEGRGPAQIIVLAYFFFSMFSCGRVLALSRATGHLVQFFRLKARSSTRLSTRASAY
jgi:hypothetical protein